jgi:GDPmannose 4,6-dehydratase
MDTKTKVALVTGITGQDGSYLRIIIRKRIYGSWVKRRASSLIRNVLIIFIKINMNVNFKLHYGDLTDSTNIIELYRKYSLMKSII